MPKVYEYKCDTCPFTVPSLWGGELFVVDGNGNRVECGHPLESRHIFAAVGEPYYADATQLGIALVEGSGHPADCNSDGACTCLHARVRERIGWASDCVCVDCLAQCRLDLGDDERTTRNQWQWLQSYAKGRPGWDKRECPSCGSLNVHSVTEMLGQPCPKCHKGVFVKLLTGMQC